MRHSKICARKSHITPTTLQVSMAFSAGTAPAIAGSSGRHKVARSGACGRSFHEVGVGLYAVRAPNTRIEPRPAPLGCLKSSELWDLDSPFAVGLVEAVGGAPGETSSGQPPRGLSSHVRSPGVQRAGDPISESHTAAHTRTHARTHPFSLAHPSPAPSRMSVRCVDSYI